MTATATLTWPPLPPEAATWPVCPECREVIGWCDAFCGKRLPWVGREVPRAIVTTKTERN